MGGVAVTLEFGCEFGAKLWVAQQYACMAVTLVIITFLIGHARMSLRNGDPDCALVCFGTMMMLASTGVLGPLTTLVHLYRLFPHVKLGLFKWSFIGLLTAGVATFTLGMLNILSRRPPRPFRGEAR